MPYSDIIKEYEHYHVKCKSDSCNNMITYNARWGLCFPCKRRILFNLDMPLSNSLKEVV